MKHSSGHPIERLESRLLLSTYTVINVNDSGPGSLRDAIQNSTADTIVFNIPGAGVKTIPLTSKLEISRSLTIAGPGAALLSVSGNNATRVFQVDRGSVAEIDGITITAGAVTEAGGNGAGIMNLGTLTLTGDIVTGSHAGQGVLGPTGSINGGDGGGVYNSGTLTMVNDTVSENYAGFVAASNSFGVAGGNGGGIYNSGLLALSSSSVTMNTAGYGGGVEPGQTSGAPPAGGSAGAGGDGGGIYSTGELTVTRSTISGNRSGDGGRGENAGFSSFNNPPPPPGNGGAGGAGGAGGGIWSSGSITVSNDAIGGNTAGSGGVGGAGFGGFPATQTPAGAGGSGGAGGEGGGIYSAAALIISECTIAGNIAGTGGTAGYGGAGAGVGSPAGNGGAGGLGGAGGSGGGIYCAAQLTISAGSIYRNSAGSGGHGGGGGSAGNSTAQSGENAAGGKGGGGAGVQVLGFLSMSNTTIAQNTAGSGGAGAPGGTGGSGGGIDALGAANIVNDTIDGNTADPGGAPSGAPGSVSGSDGNGGGIAFDLMAADELRIANTIVAADSAPAAGPDVFVTALASQGHNLVGATDGSSGWLSSDLTGTVAAPLDPRLSALGDYGGPTPTLALLPGSLAIDAGDDALAVDPTSNPPAPLTGDQRGLPRTAGAHVDIGAFEFQSGAIVVNTLNGGPLHYGQMSLPSAVDLADADPTPNTISFAPGVRGVVPISAAITLTGDLIITGPGAQQLSLTYGLAVQPGALVDVSGLTFSGANASSNVQGILSLTDCAVSLASEQSGGAINVAADARLIATGCTFSDNSAASGGAIYNAGRLDLRNCTFSGNQAMTGGAIEFVGGQATLVNSTISGNVAPTAGAIYVAGGTSFVLDNTIVAGNVAGSGIPGASDIQGPIDSSSSHNLIGTGGSGGLVNGVNGNLVGVANPGLGPLGDNGGPTQTIALLPGSPAIDAGDNALAAAAGLTTDQRGYARVFNRIVDIGAYEFGSALPGDVNKDGIVNFTDLLTLAQHYGMTNASWADGDFNGDGTVGFADLLLLAQNYGSGGPAAAAATFDGGGASNSDASGLALIRKRAARRPAYPPNVVTSR